MPSIQRGASMPKALGNHALHSWAQIPKGLGKSGQKAYKDRLLCYNVRPWNTVLLWRGSMTPLRVSLRELKLGRISTLASWLPLYMVIQIWAEIPIPVTLILTCVVPFLSVWILYPLTLPWTVTPPMPFGPEKGTLKATCTTTASSLILSYIKFIKPKKGQPHYQD